MINPADSKRCQTEITTSNPFVMGGPVRDTQRCPNVPIMIVKEKKPGPDGERGEMSMCSHCLDVFAKQQPEKFKQVALTKVK